MYMLFNVSCNHSLKKYQIETKRVGKIKKGTTLNKKFSFVLLTSFRSDKSVIAAYLTIYKLRNVRRPPLAVSHARAKQTV